MRIPSIQKLTTDWNKINAIATTIATVVSVTALWISLHTKNYAEVQIEDARKAAQTDHFIQKTEQFDSKEFREIRRSLAKNRLNQSTGDLTKLDVDDAPVEMFDELSFCNDLGILVRHGELSAYDAWGSFSYWLFPFYADAEPLIRYSQKDAPASWSNCDYLVKQINVVDQREDEGKQLKQNKDDITGFYQSEIEENRPRDSTQ